MTMRGWCFRAHPNSFRIRRIAVSRSGFLRFGQRRFRDGVRSAFGCTGRSTQSRCGAGDTASGAIAAARAMKTRAALTHALALRSRRLRVIHGLLRVSGVCNCCVFFIKPRQRTNRWPKRRLMTRNGCFARMRGASIIPMALASPQTRSEQANTKAKRVLPV